MILLFVLFLPGYYVKSHLTMDENNKKNKGWIYIRFFLAIHVTGVTSDTYPRICWHIHVSADMCTDELLLSLVTCCLRGSANVTVRLW